MKWNNHLNLDGRHAFLSPSKYHWVRYDEQKLDEVYSSWQSAQRGTELHELASRLIKNRIKLPSTPKKTYNMYINDCIGFRMDPEVTLFYSVNCFGTCDAILFKDNKLKIFDLKTGATPASAKQLEIYAAIFCLEYRCSPNELDIELRLYQNDEILCWNPDAEEILYIMQKIKDFDKRIEQATS